MKASLFAAHLLAAAVLGAAPTVTVDRVAQRYPWNGLVDIDYTVAGVSDPEAYLVEFSCTGRKGGTEPVALKPATFTSGVPSANGAHRATWDANADGADFFVAGGALTAVLRYKPIRQDGDYMIVDISGGTNAAIWRVTYMSDVADPAATFITDEYKTTKLVFKKVKAGSFWMGSTTDTTSEFYDDKAALSGAYNEAPRHYVKLTKDYFLQLFELTSGQYELMTGAMTAYNKQYYSTKPKLAVGGVCKNTMQSEASPIAALNRRAMCAGVARASFDLPTEAQWEYACRAGTTTRYFFGNDAAPLADYAWYTDKETTPSWGHNVQEPGLLLSNPWGFYDIYGNVAELVKDDKVNYKSGDEENPVVDPCGYDQWSHSALYRGGSGTWGSAVDNRSACRKTGNVANAINVVGVRLAFVCE